MLEGNRWNDVVGAVRRILTTGWRNSNRSGQQAPLPAIKEEYSTRIRRFSEDIVLQKYSAFTWSRYLAQGADTPARTMHIRGKRAALASTRTREYP